MEKLEIERRNQLIAFIRDGKDQNLIDEFYRILRISFDDSVLVTDEARKRAILEAQTQVSEGRGISEEDADREIDEWLEK